MYSEQAVSGLGGALIVVVRRARNRTPYVASNGRCLDLGNAQGRTRGFRVGPEEHEQKGHEVEGAAPGDELRAQLVRTQILRRRGREPGARRAVRNPRGCFFWESKVVNVLCMAMYGQQSPAL